MTAIELRKLFDDNDKTVTDFINWAAKWGVKVSHTEVSRHLSINIRADGKPTGVKINKGYQLAYKIYFQVFK